MSRCASCHARLHAMAGVMQHPFLLLVRICAGWGFFLAGSGKFGKMAEIVGFFTGLGIPFPEISARLVASLETAGGLFLLVGLFARWAAIPLIITMVTALLTAHRDAVLNFFADWSTFFEQEPILYLYSALVVFCFGPGCLSIDALRCCRRKPEAPPAGC